MANIGLPKNSHNCSSHASNYITLLSYKLWSHIDTLIIESRRQESTLLYRTRQQGSVCLRNRTKPWFTSAFLICPCFVDIQQDAQYIGVYASLPENCALQVGLDVTFGNTSLQIMGNHIGFCLLLDIKASFESSNGSQTTIPIPPWMMRAVSTHLDQLHMCAYFTIPHRWSTCHQEREISDGLIYKM